MTAPVVLEGAGEVWSMSFVLPSKYIENDKEPPSPLDTRVTICKVPEKTVAVKTFSGYLMSKKTDNMKQIVLDTVKNNEQYSLKGPSPVWEEYGYNSPFTIPSFRTNEVTLLLE